MVYTFIGSNAHLNVLIPEIVNCFKRNTQGDYFS